MLEFRVRLKMFWTCVVQDCPCFDDAAVLPIPRYLPYMSMRVVTITVNDLSMDWWDECDAVAAHLMTQL